MAGRTGCFCLLQILMLVMVASWPTESHAQSSPRQPVTIWLEGESPATSKVTPHRWWYDKVKSHHLSGGKWLSNFGKDAGRGEATYRFHVEQAGTYRLLMRLNPVQGDYEIRLNGAAWTDVALGAAFDQINVAADDKPDLRFIAWVELGEVKLKRGMNTLDVRINGKVDHHGAIDVIVFTADRSWTPQGTAKPGEASVALPGEEGTWAFSPKRDHFGDEALLDLSYLNEDVAGEGGWIRTDAAGDFVNDKGSIRFWAVGNTVYRRGRAALEENAKFLAKRGVNMVRWHGNLAPTDPEHDLKTPNAKALDDLFQLIAAMKDQGIYTTISPYYAHSTHTDGNNAWRKQAWGLPRDREAGNTGSLLFFDPKLQTAYKNWVRVMMTKPNPYTGTALKDEPAVGIFQIQNEDSLLFWTINSLQGQDRELLRKQFGQWLKDKYGSLAAAKRAWDGVEAQGAQRPSNWQSGSIEISNAWAWFQPDLNRGPLGQRMTDEVAFLVETMRNWNAEVERFLRDDIGAKQLINAGNWKTADPLRLNDLERYSYCGQDIIGVNRYTAARHEGQHVGWAVTRGQRYGNMSVTRNPGRLPVALKQVQGMPMILPEGNWVPPNLYQAEGPLLVAAYAGLNGVDILYWFNTGEMQWRQPSSANGYLPSVGKWVLETPEIMGNFPAAALIHRLDYITRGQPVVVEQRRLEDLWQRQAPIISEAGTFDPNRDGQDLSGQPVRTAVDQKAFLVGPVEIIYDGEPRKTSVLKLGPYIDGENKVVTSITGQHRFDYGRGLVEIEAPKAQGVVGFLNQKQEHRLNDLTIQSSNDYGAIVVVAMDDQPIPTSRKLLIQIGTTARPSGWRERVVGRDDAGQDIFEIVDHGGPPWQIRQLDATISIRNASVREAVVLDANGYPRQVQKLNRAADSGAWLSFKLPEDAKYVILR